MSWFTKYIEHPALNALASLRSNPVVAANPAAAQAVAEAQARATAAASAVSAQVQQVAATAAAQADPVLQAMGDGLIKVADAYLLTLGPPGVIAAEIANPFLAMGEHYMHNFIASLFSHARAQTATPVAPAPNT